MAALGLSLIRLRNIPSSSVKFGWLFSVVSLLWTCVYARLFWWLKSNGWGPLALYPLGFFLICSMACFLYGIFLVVRTRKPSQFARLLENNQLQTVDDLAHALGASDTAKTAQEFKRAIKQGWLNGYDFNEATGEIRVSPFPRDVFQVCRRSLVGSAFVVLSLCMLVRFGVGITTSKSPEPKVPRSEASFDLDIWKILFDMWKYAEDNKRKEYNLEMKAVPAGSFTMGSPDNEAGHHKYESPQHRVSVSAFAISKYEVTQAQWRAVMNSNPSYFKGDNLPVEQVSWEDAKAFCLKLSQLTGKAYRLPTEAEWEYAARAGTLGDYAGKLDAMGWYGDNSGKARRDSLSEWDKSGRDIQKYFDQFLKPNGNSTHEVGTKTPNDWGLYDMHGNVWEWCEDVYHDSYQGAPSDGSAWLSGGDSSRRVVRGGAWYIDGSECRSANRGLYTPGYRTFIIGFRVVMVSRTR